MLNSWRSYSHKTRTVLLIVLLVLLLLIVFFFNISKTIGILKDSKELKKALVQTDNADIRIEEAMQQKARIEAVFGRAVTEEINFQELILEKVNNFVGKYPLYLHEFGEPHSYNTGEFTIVTYHFSLQGGYHDLLRLLYLFETQYKIGRLVSVEFKTEKERRLKQENLIARIQIQNILIEDKDETEFISN